MEQSRSERGGTEILEAGERYRVEGSVETIVYHNEENGFTVLELSTEAELLTVVGEFSDIAVGETLIVTGAYTGLLYTSRCV